jgi:hypothetical protein
VRNRKSELLQIGIPTDNIAFQIGETAQVHSGGFMQVRACFECCCEPTLVTNVLFLV